MHRHQTTNFFLHHKFHRTQQWVMRKGKTNTSKRSQTWDKFQKKYSNPMVTERSQITPVRERAWIFQGVSVKMTLRFLTSKIKKTIIYNHKTITINLKTVTKGDPRAREKDWVWSSPDIPSLTIKPEASQQPSR